MIETEFIYTATITVDPPQELGRTAVGMRRIIPISGGFFDGPMMSGEVLSGGADWQVIRDDGTAFVEARYTLRTRTGALIYVENKGYRHGPADVIACLAKGEAVDPTRYYFRTVPTFETADPDLSWLTRTVCVATGARRTNSVELAVYAVR